VPHEFVRFMKTLANLGPVIQWHRVRRQLIEHSYVESSKSRGETLAGSFMGAVSRVHTTTNADHSVYTHVCTHDAFAFSALASLSRYLDSEVGNSILLSTLEFAQHLPRANPTFTDNHEIIDVAKMPVVIRDTSPRVYYV